jgi:hypothetical protein
MDHVKKGAVLSSSYWRYENEQSRGILDITDEETNKKKTLSEAKAKKYFRHLILGLDYRNVVG